MSGNGQVALQYFNTTVPLTVEARDANGNLVPNLPVTWSVTQGQGTIVSPPDRTDANGRAAAYFRGDVQPGYTFSQQSVTVTSSVGSATFVITTNVARLPNGSIAELPIADLTSPTLGDPPLTGRSGGTIPNAIRIAVVAQSGIQSGQPVPNVAFRIVDPNDTTATPPAQCMGVPMTDAQGVGKCDLLINAGPGTYGIAVETGNFRISRGLQLNVRSAESCNYTVTASSQQFGPAAGLGTLIVSAASGCDWTATSNAPWITITSGQTGNGSGNVGFTVAANTGGTRTASISLAGQTIMITQAGPGGSAGSPVQITTSVSLPSATVGTTYNATLAASGGRAPYIWLATSTLPAGLTLNTTAGTITGTPSTAGTFAIPITVTDQGGQSVTQTFSITVLPQTSTTPPPGTGGSEPRFLNTSFPNATVGVPYQELLNSASVCATPFSPPSVYTLTGGSLPAGMSVKAVTDRAYAVAGTPTAAGTFDFSVTVKDSCGKTAAANFTLTVVNGTGGSPTPPPSGAIVASPTSLSFSLPNADPGTLQQLPLTVSGPAGARFLASTTGGLWLQVIGDFSGPFPATLIVRAAPTGAQTNGTYTGAVVISSTAGTLSVPVTLTIGGAGAGSQTAALTVSPSAVNLSVEVGGFPFTQALTVSNASGVARFSAQAAAVTGGNWLSVDKASADTPANLVLNINPAGLQPGVYNASVTLTPTAPSGPAQSVPVTLRVLPTTALSSSPVSLTFMGQTGTSPAPQTIIVQSTGSPVSSTISATTLSGGNWLYVSPSQSTTPVTATVSVVSTGLAGGTYTGSIMITPAVPGVTPLVVPVTLTVPQAGPALAAISNAASFQAGAVAPGEIVTLFGSNMGPATLTTSRISAGRLDSMIEETRVYFDEIAAPLVYSSTNQISAIVPYGIEGRPTTKVVVEYRGLRSSPLEMRVAPSAPGIFTTSPTGQAAALNQDGSINGPQNGAAPGSVIVLFATGEGQTNPRGQDGKLATDATLPKPVLPVTVRINGAPATLLYWGAAPGLSAGVMQINAVVPNSVSRGVSVPVTLQVGDAISLSGATIAIRP